jgi:integrase
MKQINETDFELMIERFISSGPKGLCVALIAATGGRAQELIRVKARDIVIEREDQRVESKVDWDDITIEGVERVKIRVRGFKGSNERWVPLHKRLLAHVKSLKRELEERGPSAEIGWLINSCSRSSETAYQLLRRFFNRTQKELFGGQKYTLHAFRHTLAIRAFTDGQDILRVMTMLGHRSIQSTYHYVKSMQTEKALADIAGLTFGVKKREYDNRHRKPFRGK